jgi:hypothetical protein
LKLSEPLTAPITAAASEHQRLRTAAQTGPAATTACKNARRWLLLAGEGQRSNAVSWTSNSAPRKVGKLKLLAKQSAAGLLSRPARTSWAPPAEMPKILEKQPTIPRLHQPPLAATLFRPLSSTLSTRRERRSKRSSARASARTHETGTVCHVLFPECSDTYEHVLLRQSGHLPLTSRPHPSPLQLPFSQALSFLPPRPAASPFLLLSSLRLLLLCSTGKQPPVQALCSGTYYHLAKHCF